MSFSPVSGSPYSLYCLNRASLSFVQHGMYDFRTPRGIYFLALVMTSLQKRCEFSLRGGMRLILSAMLFAKSC